LRIASKKYVCFQTIPNGLPFFNMAKPNQNHLDPAFYQPFYSSQVTYRFEVFQLNIFVTFLYLRSVRFPKLSKFKSAQVKLPIQWVGRKNGLPSRSLRGIAPDRLPTIIF